MWITAADSEEKKGFYLSYIDWLIDELYTGTYTVHWHVYLYNYTYV